MSTAQVMVKLATMADILKAATLLHSLGLVDEKPNTFVKRYVEANPDINAALKHISLGDLHVQTKDQK